MQKQEKSWFSHEREDSNEPRMIALLELYGMEGYGQWWKLMEIFRGEENYRYNINTKFAYIVLAKLLRCTIEKAQQFIKDCIEDFELLQTDGQYIWSEEVLARMEHLEQKRTVLSERGKKGAAATNAKRWANAAQDENSLSQEDSLSVASVSQTVGNNSTVHNNTEQNTTTTSTKHNTTLQNNTSATTHNVTDMELWKQDLLNDEYFLNPYLSNNRNLTKEKLCAWLTTFNKRQAQLGETYTSARDYRQHFVNWFKYRDPMREDPNTFLSQSNNKATTVIPAVTSYMKTAAQALKEQEEAERNWHKVIRK